MGLIARFLSLFGKADDPFSARLRSFVDKESGSADEDGGGRKLSIRDKLQAARAAVDAIAGRFTEYVERRILSRHRGAFRLEIPSPQQASRIHAFFGENPTGNESRMIHVGFQEKSSLYVKVQAIILSQSLEVKAAFVDHAGKSPTHRTELPLEEYEDIGLVEWDRLFENLFCQFLDWRERPPSVE